MITNRDGKVSLLGGNLKDIYDLEVLDTCTPDRFKKFIKKDISGKFYSRYIADYYNEKAPGLDFIELTRDEAEYLHLENLIEGSESPEYHIMLSPDGHPLDWHIVDPVKYGSTSDSAIWIASGDTHRPIKYLEDVTRSLEEGQEYITHLCSLGRDVHENLSSKLLECDVHDSEGNIVPKDSLEF
ncbi:MAG: hypothetical protein ACRC0G_07170 [Fusobacteriaceae bacterium]